MKIFKSEDFDCYASYPPQMDSRAAMASIANAKLNKLIEAAPVVYGSLPFWGPVQRDTDSHRAYLMFIEELVKESCKHEPTNSGGGSGTYDSGLITQIIPSKYECKHCGVELKATWEAVGK